MTEKDEEILETAKKLKKLLEVCVSFQIESGKREIAGLEDQLKELQKLIVA